MKPKTAQTEKMPDTSYPCPTVSSVEGEIVQWAGWLHDGRRFVAHIWWWEGFLGLTYHFSVMGLQKSSRKDIVRLLINSAHLEPINERDTSYACNLRKEHDAEGNRLWAIDVFVGMVDPAFVRTSEADGSIFITPLAWANGVLRSKHVLSLQIYQQIERELKCRVDEANGDFHIQICRSAEPLTDEPESE